MRNLKIGTKLFITFGFVIILTTAIVLISVLGLNNIERAEKSMMQDKYVGVRTLLEIKINTDDFNKDLSSYLTSNDERKTKYLEENISHHFRAIDEATEIYELKITDQTEREYYEKFKSSWENYLQSCKVAYEALKDNQDEEAYALIVDLQSLYDNVSTLLNECVLLNDDHLQQEARKVEILIRGGKICVIITYILVVITALICALVLCKSITKSTKRILDFVKEASKGDLSKEIEVTSKDEMGMISEYINNLVRSLRYMISQITEVAESVAASSEELSATAEETSAITEEVTRTINGLADGAGQQSQTVQEANDTVEGIAKNIKDIVASNELVIDSTKKVLNVTDDGKGQANNAIAQIRKIESGSMEALKVISNLNSQSEKIGQIVGVIKDLSSQTDLLALNAAIEAARAGEQGKGFAVVAEEVKKLAEESSQSAGEIEVLIQSIQNQTREAVKITEASGSEVVRGVEAVEIATSAFETVVEEINIVVEQINTAYDLSQKTLKESEVIVKSMENVNKIAMDSAASTEEVSASAQEQNASMESVVDASEKLAGLGNNLQELINKFEI